MDAPGTEPLRLRPDRTGPLEALLVGAGEHVVPVVDVESAVNGDLVLHVPVPTARLVDLLRVPGFPTAGEAVTVLVPLAGALARLHARGVALGAIAADAVVLDGDGSPAWSAPDRPVLRRRDGEPAFAAAAREDRAAFHALVVGLLGRAGIAAPAADAVDLEQALFAVADPEPVRLHPEPLDVDPAPPGRLVPAAAASSESRPAASVVARLVAPLRSVRKRLWAVLAVPVVLLVAAVVLLPARAGAAPHRPITSTRAASPERTASQPPRTPTPVEAPAALVRARAGCLSRGSATCLTGVDAADSPVLVADLAALRAGTEAVPVRPERLRVRSASGGTVLAEADGVVVLAVRQPDGWRLRDVVREPAPTATAGSR